MPDQFDPYHKWLAIPPSEQPPNHYRLLGLPLFESDQEVIAAAAVQRMNFVRKFLKGEHAKVAAKVASEVTNAWSCLINPPRKQGYDASLRGQSRPAQQPVPLPAELNLPPSFESPHFAEELQQLLPPELPPPTFHFPEPTRSDIPLPIASPPIEPQPRPSEPVIAQPPAPTPVEPFGFDLAPPAPTPGDKKSKRRNKSPAFEFVKIILGGMAGLALGYIILCQIGPEYDFLNKDADKAATEKQVANQNAATPVTSAVPASPQQPASKQPTPKQDDPKSANVNRSTIEPRNNISSIPRNPDPPTIPTTIQSVPEPRPEPRAMIRPKPERNNPFEEPGDRSAKNSAPTTAAALEEKALKSATAQDALNLYRAFLEAGKNSEQEQTLATARLSFWEDAVNTDLVRLGKKWITRDQQRRHDEAQSHAKKAIDLLAANDEDKGLKELKFACSLEPESSGARLMIGIWHAVADHDFAAARADFDVCDKLQPNDSATLNNLAVAEVLAGANADYADKAYYHFRSAIERGDVRTPIVHNVKRVVEQRNLKNLKMPERLANEFEDLSHASDDPSASSANDKRGWIYILPGAQPERLDEASFDFGVLKRFEKLSIDPTSSPAWIEDHFCMTCRGRLQVLCTNCVKGKVPVQRDVINVFPNGSKTKGSVTTAGTCKVCHGTGLMTCPDCKGKGG